MMSECNSDMLLDYVNNALTHQERGEVLRHISACAACREELSELIAIKRLARQSRAELLKDARAHAFDLLPQKEAAQRYAPQSAFSRAMRPALQAMRPVIGSLELVKETIKIAANNF